MKDQEDIQNERKESKESIAKWAELEKAIELEVY